MTTTPQLPAGETLPQYDDQHPEGVDIEALHGWLATRLSDYWRIENIRERTIIREVLTALQATGDATLVKNETYRMMRRDGADVERLAARLSRENPALLVECGGNPVTAVLAVLDALDITAPGPAVTG